MTSTSNPSTLMPPVALQLESSPDGAGDVYVFPASFAQARLWFLHQLEPESTAYNVDMALRLFGALRVDALEAACVALVRRHEILRTTFAQEGSDPLQVVHQPPAVFPVEVVDLTAASPSEREQQVRALIHDVGHRGFDLATGPLLRLSVAQLGSEEHVLIASMHHIVSDGWSLGVFIRELGALYRAAVSVGAPERDAEVLIALAGLEPLPIQYGDFSQWQRDWLSGDEMARQESFWRGQLGGMLPTLELPADHPRPPIQGYAAATYRFELPEDVSIALTALGRREGATLYMTLLAAYGAFLQHYTGDEDFVVGSPIAGRTRTETEGLIGMFVNTLALRVDVSGQPSFREVLRRVRDMLIDAYAHQDLPFERLVHMLQPVRDRRRSPLFQTMMDLQNAREVGFTSFGDLRAARVAAPQTTAKFDVQLSFSETPRGLRGLLIYATDLFDEGTIARMAEHFGVLASAIVADPDAPINRLSLLTPQARVHVLSDWNATAMEYPRDKTVADLVREQIASTPQAIAVEFEGATLTYAELDVRADRLATYLRARGVGPEVMVAVYLDRSFDLPIALLAIHRAGGAYVPLDPSYPRDRLEFMLSDSGARILVTQESLRHVLPSADALTVSLDGERDAIASADATPLPRASGPDSLAYVIYTSGSTGRPKGVLIQQGSLVNFLVGFNKNIPLGPGSTWVAITPLSFDISGLELFLPLITGARIVIAPRETSIDPDALAALVDKSAATHLQATPSTWRMLVEHGWRGRESLIAMCGGEALTPTLTEALLQRTAQLWNLYGPTESTVWATMYRATEVDVARSTSGALPIGKPMGNVRTYVLDAAGQPTPPAIAGELFVGGDGVVRGYHNRDELTAVRFVPDPFSDRAAALMYRSGDRARWRADGVLEFLGRLDFQVKIRGHRIEPGEVESCLAAVPGIAQAAVVARPDATGAMRLLGYYVPQSGAAVTAKSVRAVLREMLTEHMVPSVFTEMDALPLSPNGKIDRKSLPEPQDAVAMDRAYVPPRTTLEHELVQIWERLFPGRQVSITDDFFEIGGHSLLAVHMLAEVANVRGRRVPLAWLFETSTVETLAARLGAEVQAEREPSIVVLQEQGTDTPLAFVHGDVRGGGWYCRRLAPLAAPGAPMLVLPTIGVDDELRAWTVEAMAAQHVAELRRVQPEGPYRVAGFCIGGIIAYEMAHQLREAGQVVDRLVIIDSASMNTRLRLIRPLLGYVRGADENTRLTRQANIMDRMRWYDMRVRQVRRRPLRQQWQWVRANVARRIPGLRPRDEPTNVSSRSIGVVQHDAQTARLAAVLRTPIAAGPGATVLLMQERAASAYIPKSYDGVIDLIWADSRPGVRRADPTRGWGAVARAVHIYPILTTHIGLITNDLPLLATALREVLERDRT